MIPDSTSTPLSHILYVATCHHCYSYFPGLSPLRLSARFLPVTWLPPLPSFCLMLTKQHNNSLKSQLGHAILLLNFLQRLPIPWGHTQTPQYFTKSHISWVSVSALISFPTHPLPPLSVPITLPGVFSAHFCTGFAWNQCGHI